MTDVGAPGTNSITLSSALTKTLMPFMRATAGAKKGVGSTELVLIGTSFPTGEVVETSQSVRYVYTWNC